MLGEEARAILSRATPVPRRAGPTAPVWLAYSDTWIGSSSPPATSDIEGFNVFALSFWLLSGAADNAEAWTTLSASERSTVLSQYEAAGISLIVSAFGSTDIPTTSGADPTDTANKIAAWVQQYGLAGVDVDYEDFAAFNAGTAEAWLITFTTQLRSQLPSGSYIITHAPVAPWFCPKIWTGGGYLQINSEVGSLIDWYNIQFYNQGSTEYTTANGLLTESSSTWPQSALFQIAANGVDLNKIVIGKPATASDASNGYMDPSTLATCLQQAQSQGWSAGAMVWQYPHATSSWIATVRAGSWPVAAGSPPAPPTMAVTAPPTTDDDVHPNKRMSFSLGLHYLLRWWRSG